VQVSFFLLLVQQTLSDITRVENSVKTDCL